MTGAGTPHRPGADLHELTSIREAHVFKGDRLAAVLRRLTGGVEFGYLPEYLAAGVRRSPPPCRLPTFRR